MNLPNQRGPLIMWTFAAYTAFLFLAVCSNAVQAHNAIIQAPEPAIPAMTEIKPNFDVKVSNEDFISSEIEEENHFPIERSFHYPHLAPGLTEFAIKTAFQNFATRLKYFSKQKRNEEWLLYICKGADGRLNFIDQISNKDLFRQVKSIQNEIHFFETIHDQNNRDYNENNNIPAIPRVDGVNNRAYIYDINGFISSQ